MTHFIYMSGEVYSPPSGGMATPPYTDLPSPPTVVADYNRPYDSVSTKGPHLLVTEQPQSKFRFRYKSEMVGTHGQLKAERADKNKAIFPTVKLANWNEGSALIRLALYTGEENCTLRRRHVHELSGKNCDKVTGICEMVVDQTTDYLAAFQNLGIIHIAKREVKEIIKQRKKAALVDHAKLRRPERSHEEIRQSITPTDMKKIDEEAEEVARTMDLNKVVLRFQAFQYDDNQRCYKAVTRFVDSELVVNLKNASTGELKIVRMSGCSAPCTGGSEVWMLVEKVKKSNIRIKFFELDSDGSEVWSAYAEFSEGDVHHQYAIIFKTPPYRSTNLRSSVRVKVQLERINDKDISEPRDFTYHPESLKRQSPFTDSVLVEEDEDYHQGGGGRTKRLCQGSSDHALDLRFSNGRCPSDGEIMEALVDYCSQGLAGEGFKAEYQGTQQSPPYAVPSPHHPGASPSSNSSHSFYVTHTSEAMEPTPFLQVSESAGHLQVLGNPAFPFTLSPTSVAGDALSPQYQPSSSPLYQVPSPQQVSSPLYQAPSPQQVLYQQAVTSPMYQQYSPSSDQLVPNSPHQSSVTQQQPGDSLIGAPQLMQQQQQQQSIIPQLQIEQQSVRQQQPLATEQRQHILPQQSNVASLNTPTIPTPSQSAAGDGEWDFSNLMQTPAGGVVLPDLYMIDSVALETINPDFFTGSDLQTDCIRPKAPAKSGKQPSTSSINALTQAMAGVAINTTQNKQRSSHTKQELPVTDSALRVALRAADSLQAYRQTGDAGRLLETHRHLLGVQNRRGDNALHTAVSSKNVDAFDKIMEASSTLRPSELVNMQNYAGETPLHLAVRGAESAMSSRLISCPGSDVSRADKDGNTPLHLAAALSSTDDSSVDIMTALLTRPINGARCALETAMQTYNYLGETALHVSVRRGNGSAVRQLLASGSDVHMCERLRGANCLHIAVKCGHPAIAAYLIKETDITVNARMFDGNTALHVAVQEGNAALSTLLMQAGADPTAENDLKIRKPVVASQTQPEQSATAITRESFDDLNTMTKRIIEDRKNSEEGEEEETDEEEDEAKCYTPLDYAGNRQQLLEILKGS